MACINAGDSHYLRTRNKAREPLSQGFIAGGIRLTPRRRAPIEIPEETNRNPDAAGLLEAAKQRRRIDRVTVYRALELLKEQGLTTRHGGPEIGNPRGWRLAAG